MQRIMFGILSAAALSAGALAQTVTVTLDSPQDGLAVAPGSTINWSINYEVSTADGNAGLALLIVDLQQDNDNPAFFDIPAAASVPSGMSNFSRPAGVSNRPDAGQGTTGYVGLQRGVAGRRNLIQIGGGQNTFGTALSGSGVGENANVVGAVGQSGPELLAEGSFVAPSACGTYIFNLASGTANTLVAVQSPPLLSPATGATVDLTGGTITVIVGFRGDTDGDNDVDLTDLARLLANFGLQSGATLAQGDIDGDGDVDLTDLATLLANFGSACA